MQLRGQWRISRRIRRNGALKKQIYQTLKFRNKPPKTIIFIVGCQRSGTSMVLNSFERDLKTTVYRERGSKLSSMDINGLRLNPLNIVAATIANDSCAPVVVLKPLVETQNTMQLLEYFEGSKALWVYRNYRDVTCSNIHMWGVENAKKDLRFIVKDDTADWRAERVPGDITKLVCSYFAEGMSPYDAGALFWYVRNSLFFQLNLDRNPNVIMCKYEDFVIDPNEYMKRIYDFVNCAFPGKGIIKHINASSVGKGKNATLSVEIDEMCNDMLEKLDIVHQRQVND